jgi:processive 1,2-diacylglycerol beta-glucosyltransferase
MKILILSCNTGEGHNSSGKALQAALMERGVQCDMEDTLAIRSEWLSKVTSELYEFSIKISLFGLVYRLAEHYSALQLKSKSPIYALTSLYTQRLAKLIQEGHYDGVICVHLFPAEAITRIRHIYGQHLPTIFVMTDYTCIPLLYETELDKYVIAHDGLTEEFIRKGLSREKLQSIGIPVNEDKFAGRISKVEARKQVNALFEWEESDGKWYLIMGGSMGFGNITKLIRELKSKVSDSDRIICVCGKNEGLKQSIHKHFSESPNVKALGYTHKISLIMDACDVLLTKPGGITSTEAIIKNIPLVHINPIKGLEEDNAAFFKQMGMALGDEDVREQTTIAIQLSHDAGAQEKMAEIQRRNSNINCSHEIADMIISMAQAQRI